MSNSSTLTQHISGSVFVDRLKHMPTFLLCLTVLVGMILEIRPAYALNAGDIAVIGVRADDIDGTIGNGNDDAFAWVPFVNLAPSAEIFFTDAGWTASNTFRPQEGAIKYTAPAGGLAAGTVMLLELTNSSGDYTFTPSGGGGTYSDADDAIVGTNGLLPATLGDNLFIFEGSTASPSFIWGWKNEGPFDADSTSNDTTALPPGLTVGVNAISTGSGASTDVNRYVGITSGTTAQLAATIANPANWEAVNDLPFPSGGNDITNGTSSSGFTVGPTNQAPVLSAIGNQSVDEGQLLEFTVTATDPEGDALSFSLSNGPTGATLTDNGDGTATFSWTPDFDQAGNYPDVLFTVSDDGSPVLSDSEAITITVGNVNRPPQFDSIGSQTTDEGVELSFTVQATDPDGDAITLTVSNEPTGAVFSDNGDGSGTFTWTPDFGQSGNFTVMFIAIDDGVPAQNDTLDVTITVGEVNRPPVLNMIGDRTVAEGQLLEFTLTATDPDGDNLSYAVGNAPAGATFTDNGDGTATFSWTPVFDQAGNFPNVLFTVNDDGVPAQSDSEAITITVGNVNRPPVLGAIGNRTVAEGELLEVVLMATDPDGDNLSYPTPADLPPGATFTDNGDGTATFSWTPDFDQAGNYDVTFRVDDDGTPPENDTEVVMITVGSVNRPPTLDPIGNREIDQGELLEITLTSSDPDGDNLSYPVPADLPLGATFADNNDGTATFNWTPGPAQIGDFMIGFSVSDGDLSVSEDVTVTVNSVGEQPFASCGDFDVFETTPGVFEAPSFNGEVIVGTNRSDWLPGTNRPDLILGLGGHDIIFGRRGDDVICGGSGRDFIKGQSGDDMLYGEDGRDVLIGGRNNDQLFGGNDRDFLHGSSGDDNLNGGNGNDFCRGGQGNDTVDECE